MRYGYRTLVTGLGLAMAVALAQPADAQTRTRARSSSSSSQSSARTQSKTTSSTRARASSSAATRQRARATSAATTQQRARTATATATRQRARATTTTTRTPTNTVRINVAPSTGNRGTISRNTRARDANGDPAPRDGTRLRAREQPRTGAYVAGKSTTSRDDSYDGRRDYDRDRRDGNGYDRGYHRGYDRGYGHGYRKGYYRGYRNTFYLHYRYYGPNHVFGWHYGGFGFYGGRWHFAIVIGGPLAYGYRYNYYRYSWWDGLGPSLLTWDRALTAYPADYSFDLSRASCVSLWIRTVDGHDYVVRADPRYWGASDPGDLYSMLWAELDREGQLYIEDINGAVHVFPAGMIQQIEATACR